MPSYRIYFRSRSDAIHGRQDFEAEDDRAALFMAELLYEACSDVCDTFELWQGMRLLDAPRGSVSRPSESVLQISARMQESLILSEEAIRRSQWAIARSHRLLERMHQLEDDVRKGR